jgi:diguanylate cyclase (GGDEF)-like protein
LQIDIDRFKEINDALGHAAGDQVLKKVAAVLRATFGPQAGCFRIGGDEFLVILRDAVTAEAVAGMAESLIAKISTPISIAGHHARAGASIGIAFGRNAGFDAKISMMNADLALYDAKRSGRNQFRFFSSELANVSQRRKALSDRILEAIDAQTFVPFYQPQFFARNRALRGVEVLCRWQDPEYGWVPPGEFIAVAEELGVVARIDEILFERVAADLARLRRGGLAVPRVSFNITLDRLLQADLAQKITGTIDGKVKVALELLESMTLDTLPEAVAWSIDALKENGIEIEIDDFGSHRASLAGLMAVMPHAMKIDRAIVTPIIESPRHFNLVKKIIDIGALLNIEVIAEGVETEDHVQQLTALGCGVLQGFGLAAPMPFEDFEAFCRRTDASGRLDGAVA